MTYLQRLIANALIFISLSVLFPEHIYVESLVMAIAASFVLSILNTLVKPILILLSLPLNILTLGLFSFVISAGMLQLTSNLLGNYRFGFSSFTVSILVAVVMAIINAIVSEHNIDKYADR
ncbi:phage holin family protein [Enterococcus dongliensis]|mgnify:FL=1|uniref:Phage holin family protein n=1 Tax=Enterococcus dongliensis TaxID=2559925 RepID=A0AAP5NLB7_9ENTE|nr:phage holin family protein [Enterococcus dongliensis]MDT2596537.1 phage holin family protein [Enterococcus dongliensis]MDT2603602.1 phage holin family protein [Enterococcus dongliensis]MDT2612556.1 phage holin family protein [Enterococcus dongliensis]MDT2634477.1 phage holin family protein [Enterococcus dongliensis]MDT2637322.1 phage holin family protein [Enterococcus dongliensis]